MNTVVLSSIVNAESLPSMPAVAFKVLELCRQDDVNIQDVAAVIEKDPALTGKMMKVANSSMFGMSKKVGTIQQAMVVLGLRTVKIMALGFSLVESMNGKSALGFDYPSYWRRSLSTAVAARQLSGVMGDVRRDEAFVGGLLCDIGMVAAERHPDRIYTSVIEQHRSLGGRIQDIEEEALGITHAQISAMMLANWSMPEMLSHAVSAHHGEAFDDLEPRVKSLAATLWAASEIAELFCGDAGPSDFTGVWERTIARLGISSDGLEGVLEVLNEQVREAADMFSVQLGDEITYDVIRQGAMAQLATLSMNAECERAVAENRAQEAQSRLKTLGRLTETLKHQATTDKLTGIANRRAFDMQLNEAISVAEETKSDLGLVLIDLDHFKKLNDEYGHLAGDETLRLIGRCLNKACDEACFAARYGGEEFALVVAEATARELRSLAEDVRKSISRIRFEHEGQAVGVTASLGAAHVSFVEESVHAVELIRRADECLYDAKREGRDRVEITF